MRRYFPPVLVLLSLTSCGWSAFFLRADIEVWSVANKVTPAITQLLLPPANAQESSSSKIRNLEIDSLPTLRVGDEASEVAKLQTNLQKLGYYNGEISNTFNQATQEALTQFQQEYNLTADGVAGPNTWETLLVTAATASDTAGETESAENQNQQENADNGQQGQKTDSEEKQDASQSNGGWRSNFNFSQIALLVFAGIFGLGAFAGLFAILLKLSGSEADEFETPPPQSGKSSSDDGNATAAASKTNPFATAATSTAAPSPSQNTTESTTETSTTKESLTEASETQQESETGVISSARSLEESQSESTQVNGKSAWEGHTASETGSQVEEHSSQEASEQESSLSQNQPSQLAKINIVEELIKELQAPDPVKRRKAIWELGQQGDSRAVYPLLNLMLESDSKQQGLILAAMSEIGTRITRPLNQALVMALQADKPEVRKNAIRDLMRVYDAFGEVSHLLSHAHHDPDPQVQETAQWAIAKLHRLRAIAQGDIPNVSRRFPTDEISLPSPVQQVVNVMLFRGEITLEEAAECTGYERDTVEKMLEPLVKQNIISRYEGEEGIFYRLYAQNPDTK